MEERLWDALQTSGCSCVHQLKLCYRTPWHLACAVDVSEDCTNVVAQISDNLTALACRREGAFIWKWISDQKVLLQRLQLQLLGKARKITAHSNPRSSPADTYEQLVSGSIALQKQVSRSQLRWSNADSSAPGDAEKAARRFWGMVLVQIILEAGLPISQMHVDSDEQLASYALRSLGVRRSKTLRNRARCWKKARQWLLFVKEKVFPKSPEDVLDYLDFLSQEVGTITCVDEFMAALSVLEDAGQVPLANQLSKNRLVLAAAKSHAADLKSGKTTRKQAPPLTIAMLISLELYVCSGENPKYGRCLAWACLVCIWACVRVSDLQGMDVSRLMLFASGLKGILTHTKTTGHDKRVSEVPFFIRRDANLSGADWMQVGLNLWKSFGRENRSYLVWTASHDLVEPIYKYAKPENVANYMRLIWNQLRVPRRAKVTDSRWQASQDPLVRGSCYLFWSGHSMRHVLPTLAAVFGEPKERRDYLGRWHVGLQQSSDYVHTCRQIVHGVQQLVGDKLSGGSPGYEEDELLDSSISFPSGFGTAVRIRIQSSSLIGFFGLFRAARC